MRIRRTLQISAVVSITSVAMVAATIIILQIMDADHAAATMNLNAAVRKISLIRGFLPELSGSSHQRAALQWQAQFAELTPILTAIPTLDGRAQSLKVRILEDHAAVGALFDNLSIANQSTVPKENLEIIGDQLDVRTASMISDVLAMNNMTAAYINRQKRWVHAVMAVSVTVLAGVIVGLVHIFHRRIVTPIVKLEEATALFSAGKLEQPISISGSDEITALAASFDYMRIALRDRLMDLDAARTLIKEENQKLAQRVEERTAELEQKVEELNRSNEELRQFAYVASHDLQEPLRIVASFTQLLSRRYKGKLDSDADEFIFFIVDGASRMQRLIQDLLAYSRVGTKGNDLLDTSSEGALHQALINLRGAIEENGALVTHDPLPPVLADEIQLIQLFQNLVGNAIKYQSPGVPRVHISAAKNGEERWIFSVQDNGLGIDSQYFEKIFGMFQRLHTREEFSGTGIGLAICKKIVERHGGSISVESQPGQGSTFRFDLAESERKS